MSKIVEFKISKGITVETEEGKWPKKSLELTVQLPEKHTDKDVSAALAHAEYLIDTFLGQPEVEKIPQFNPEELMKHEWKGKKTGDGEYAKGSLSWGWDFKDQFSKEVIAALEKGPFIIDEYEFTLGETIVNVKKKKKSER